MVWILRGCFCDFRTGKKAAARSKLASRTTIRAEEEEKAKLNRLPGGSYIHFGSFKA